VSIRSYLVSRCKTNNDLTSPSERSDPGHGMQRDRRRARLLRLLGNNVVSICDFHHDATPCRKASAL
jgi:hypothetical protein